MRINKLNKRPEEIEDAMDKMDYITMNGSECSVELWNILYCYIEALENTIHEIMLEEMRRSDDGK